jgi:phytoene dehydrogenase-like protein
VADRDPEVVVIGSGPNGLVAACLLARRGLRVLCLEGNPRRPGGALGTEEGTIPGFHHDVGAAFFPLGQVSPAYKELPLEEHGLTWSWGEFDSCHPALDGSEACISRDRELTAKHFGSAVDGARFQALVDWHARIQEPLVGALFSPFPSMGPMLRVGVGNLLRITWLFLKSTAGLSRGWFESETARRVLPGLALHADVGPDDAFGAPLAYVLGFTAATVGFPVPRGGAQSITNALVTILEEHGGKLRLGARVKRVVVRERRAVAVQLTSGEEIAVSRGILADTSAPALFLELLPEEHVSGRIVRRMKRFPYAWGTFKVDWALSGPVPWISDTARRSAVVHLGESIEDLSRFTAEVRDGKLPERPYLVIGQQSLLDPTRAPPGQHTLYGYTHAPSNPEGGWKEAKHVFADRVEQRIEELAPGFKATILERRVVAPPDLEAQNPNLVGGDLGGGSSAWHNQLVFRPVFPYFRYRTPVDGLYLCSSYAHPGGGAHGMCGYNAARALLDDLG